MSQLRCLYAPRLRQDKKKQGKLHSDVLALFLFLCCIWLWVPVVVADDDAVTATNDGTGSASGEGSTATTTIPADDGSCDAAILACGFFLCAAALCAFGVALAHALFQEDRLMRTYKEQGLKLTARVWSADFCRARPVAPAAIVCTSCGSKSVDNGDDDDQPSTTCSDGGDEYSAVIGYRVAAPRAGDEEQGANNEAAAGGGGCGYGRRVRKQVLARKSDFVPAKAPTYTAIADPSSKVVRLEFHDACPAPTRLSGWPNIGASRSLTDRSVPLELEILVLPGHRHSALPARFVERACSPAHRLPTIALLAGNFALAWTCVALGWVCVLSAVGSHEEDDASSTFPPSTFSFSSGFLASLGYGATAVFAGMLITAVAVVHGCLANPIQNLLRSEYLEGGGAIFPEDDSYSLASADEIDDDSYLRW